MKLDPARLDVDSKFEDWDDDATPPPAPSRPAESEWKPVTARDVDDLGLLPAEVRLLRGEVADLRKDVQAVTAAVESLTEMARAAFGNHVERIAALEQSRPRTTRRKKA